MKTLIKTAIFLLPLAGMAQDRKTDSIEYRNLIMPINEKLALINSKRIADTEDVKSATEALQVRYSELNKEYVMACIQFYKSHYHSYIGLKAFNNAVSFSNDKEKFKSDFYNFSPELQSNDLGKSVLMKLNTVPGSQITKMGKPMEIGDMGREFTQNNVDGKPIRLSDFKGKYVLMDFWASWCKPCREENPAVVKVFSKFRNKNFTVLSVSLDSDKDKWVEAIQKDVMPWYHVSDLQHWNNAVAKLYGITSVPQNFLIDPTGKIVAKNLRGEELYKKVEELLREEKSK